MLTQMAAQPSPAVSTARSDLDDAVAPHRLEREDGQLVLLGEFPVL
jgi:hypothetical protein